MAGTRKEGITRREALKLLAGLGLLAVGGIGSFNKAEAASKRPPVVIRELGRGPFIGKGNLDKEQRRAKLFSFEHLAEAAEIFVASGDLHPTLKAQWIAAMQDYGNGSQRRQVKITRGLEANAMLGRSRSGIATDLAPGDRKLIFDLEDSSQGLAEAVEFTLSSGSVRQDFFVVIPEECFNITLLAPREALPNPNVCEINDGWSGQWLDGFNDYDNMEGKHFEDVDVFFLQYSGILSAEKLKAKVEALKLDEWYGLGSFIVAIDKDCDGHPEEMWCINTKVTNKGPFCFTVDRVYTRPSGITYVPGKPYPYNEAPIEDQKFFKAL